MNSRKHQPVEVSKFAARSAAPTSHNFKATEEVDKTTLPFWQDLFASLPATEQRELLALAVRQGLLYSHQLPASRNGAAKNEARVHKILDDIARECFDHWPEPDELSLTYFDQKLDPTQRDAVAKALAAPEIFVIAGFPATGKCSVAAEIIAQCSESGERVLLTAASGQLIDHVLELTSKRPASFALRCLDKGEMPASLSPTIRALTLAERVRELSSVKLPDVRKQIKLRQERHVRLQSDEAVWPKLLTLAQLLEDGETRQKELANQHAQVLQQVREASIRVEKGGAADKFQAVLAQCRLRHQETLRYIDGLRLELERRLHDSRLRERDVRLQLERLKPFVEARQRQHFWRAHWWRSFLFSGLWKEYSDLTGQAESLSGSCQSVETELGLIGHKLEHAHETLRVELEDLIQREMAERRCQLEKLRHQIEIGQEPHRQEWNRTVGLLKGAPFVPQIASLTAVLEARAKWRLECERTGQELRLANAWADCLQESGAMQDHLLNGASVVAGTPTALAVSGVLNAGSEMPQFDRLLILGADQFTENEFSQLASHAQRWILVGDPLLNDLAEPHRSASGMGVCPDNAAKFSSSGLTHASQASFFRSLWTLLGWDLRRLPYTWEQEKDGLVCRLKPVHQDERRFVEMECVADCPQIRLRILSLRGTRPQLVEVVFPDDYPIERAKMYIYHELDELAIQVKDHLPCWAENADQVILHLTRDGDSTTAIPVPLSAGIREMVVRGGPCSNGQLPKTTWQTCRLEFDRNAGWNRRAAEQWARRRLGDRAGGRTSFLTVAHATSAGLASFISEFLPFGGYQRPNGPPVNSHESAGSCVEFVAVPQQRREKGKNRSASGLSLPRMGAGLELDLADPKQRGRLPLDLRMELPHEGFANFLEAQAVIRELEMLTSGAAGAPITASAADAAWQVGVLALYEGQTELIRGLARQNARLLASRAIWNVATAGKLPKHRYDVVLLSLTRSHLHRAVSFGSSPDAILWAMTRAGRRLIVFGDIGTLVRRSMWDGPLDHLNAVASARERQTMARLMDYIAGKATQKSIFALREGTGA
jgi:hypothetical protein